MRGKRGKSNAYDEACGRSPGNSNTSSYKNPLTSNQPPAMHTPYRGRCHTKKQKQNCKPSISPAERKKRKQQKQIASAFPTWKHFLPCLSHSGGGRGRFPSTQIEKRICNLSPAGGGSTENNKNSSNGVDHNHSPTLNHLNHGS